MEIPHTMDTLKTFTSNLFSREPEHPSKKFNGSSTQTFNFDNKRSTPLIPDLSVYTTDGGQVTRWNNFSHRKSSTPVIS